MTEPALARPHRHGGVTLRELDRVEALGDRVLEVLRRLVLAEADEALVAAVIENRARHRGRTDVAGDGTHSLDVVGQVGRDEDAAALVVLDPGARLGEQLEVGLRATGHDDEVGLHEAAADRDLRDLAAFRLCLDRRAAALAEVDDPRDLDTRGLEVGGRIQAAIVDREHDGALSRLDREAVDQAPHGVGQHHPDEIVAGEDERLLDDPAGDDDAMRPVLEQQVAVGDGNEALLEEADRYRRRQQLDPRLERLPPELGGDVDAVPRDEKPTAGLVALVDHHDGLAAPRRRDRRLQSGPPAADHGDVDMAVLDVDTLFPRSVRIEGAEPGRSTEELLVERPQLARADERLVVEARRCEGTGELVGQLHQVTLERADVVLPLDHGAVSERRRADADARDSVDRHLAVGAMTGTAGEPSRPVVLEAPREHPLAGRVERRADRVAGESLHRLAVERERERPGAVDPLPACGARRVTGSAPPSLRASRSRLRMPRRLDDVRIGVPVGEEPVLTRAAEPPLALRAPDVAPEVDVLVQLAHGRGRGRPLRRLARASELLHLARAAVGTGDEHRHSICARRNSVLSVERD